jgi:hypothetical protein
LVVDVLLAASKDCGLVRDYGADRCREHIVSGLRAGMRYPYPALGDPK